MTTVEYTCHDGYELIGVNKLTCQADGEWNNNDPYCSGKLRKYNIV